jgi:SAM-dependent MidA family methyltransferase
MEGTLACYYRHRRHDNPFINIGLQDITASVDFTRVAESAHASGLDIYGYTNQAGFLVSCGLERILAEISAGDDRRHLAFSQQAGKLLLPGQMGETFKVMSLGKNLAQPLIGTGFGSQLHRL